jgi:hypothetical protein
MRVKVPTAGTVKIAVFWGVAPCSLVDIYGRIGGTQKV